MACDAIVTAKNGNSSILYNSILEQVGSAEAALNIYLHITKNNIKSEQLDVNGEYVFTKEQIKEFDETVHNYEHPTVDMLLRYHRILKPLTNEDYELTSYPIVIEDGVVHKDALAALLHFEAPQYIMFSASTADEALNFLRRLNAQLQDESITNTIDYLEDQKRYLEKGVILTKDAYDNYDQYVKNADPSKLLSNTQLDIMLKATQAQLLTVSLDVAYTNMINGTYEAIYDKYLLGREPKARNFKSLEENIPPKYALVANDPIESGIIPIPSNLISGFSYNEEKYAINIVSTVLIQLASNLGSMKMKDALEGNTIKGEVIKYYYAILKNKPNLTASQKAVNAKVIRELQKDDSILWDKVKVEARVNSGFVITELDDLQFDPDDVSNSFDENLQFKVAPENRITAEVKTTINNIARLDPNNYTIVDGVRVFEKNTNNPGGLSTMMRASEVIPVLIQHTATSVNVEDMLNRIKQIGELSDPSYMVLYDKLVNNKELSNLFFSSIKSEAINRTTVKIQKENGEVTYKPIFQNKTSYIGYQIADNWLDNIKLKTLSKFYKNAGLLDNITNHYEGFKNKIGVSRVAEVINLFNALGIPLTPHMVMTLIESANVPVGTSPSEKYKDSTNYQLDAKADIVLNAYFNNLVEGIMTYINEEGKSDFRQYGTLYRLANKLSIFIPPTTSAYMNIDGNQEQTFNKPTFISDWFNNMDNDEYFFELLSNMARDPKLIHSNWLFTKSENEQGFLAYAANEEGDTEFITDLNNIEYDRLVLNKAFYKGKKQAFKLDFFEGIEDTTIGFKARYTDITDDDWVYASVLNYFMADSANNYARYFLLTPADRGNTRTISAPRIPITNEEVGNGYVVSRTSHLHKAVYNIFLGELERMTAAYNHMYKLDENNNLIETPKEQLYVNYHYKDNKPGNAFNFHHFKYTDRKGKVQDLNEVISKLLPKDAVIDNRILANEEVMNAVNNFITKMMSFIAYSEVKQNSNNLSITTRFLDKRFGTSKSYRTAMTEYAINRYIAGVEMMNFFMGDIAFYASSDDANKRATEMLASGVANSHFGTNVPFYGVTIADRKITDTSIINSIRTVLKKQGHKQEIIDKIANAYRDFKGSDSQSYITYEEFKNRLELFGIKSQYNDLLARIEDEAKEINIEDLDAFVQLQKNFYYGYDFDETLSIFVPNQVKNTESVLVPRFIKGTELEKLDEAMKANEIVQVNFSSAEKTGSKYIANVTNENGDLNFDVLNEEFAKGKRKYYYKNLRKQQDVVNHMIDEDNKLGVQIAKKIIDNVNDPAVVKQLFDLYVSNIVESSNKLIEDFGITTNDNGEYEVDNKKLSDYLRQQYIQRGKNYNFLYGVQIDDVTGTLRAGLDYTPTLKTNLAAITSLFTNRIVNQKHPGSHGPHMTNAFMKAIAGGKNASQLPTRKDLKFTRFVDKNGELIYEAAEILLPHTAKAFFDNNVTIEDLQKAGLDTIVGYRIPTEDKHSMIVFKIVGFLDPAEGSTMVVPDGIVPQTGADFDFDSLYTMHYNFRVNPDGSISKINYSEDDDSIKDRYIGYVFSNAKRSTKTKIVEELKAAANRSYSAYKGQLTKLKNENKELNRDVMHQVFSFIDDIGSKVIVDDLRNNFEINMSGYGLNIQESMELLSIYISQQMEMMDRSVGAAIEYGLTEDAAKYASYVNKYASIKVMVSFAMEEFGMAKQTEKEYVDSIKQKMNDRYWNDFAYNTAVNVANLTGLPTITDFAKLPMTEQNGRKARENKILDIYIQILSDPTNYIEVATPNNMDDTNASKELADSFYNPAAEVLPYTAGGTQNSYRSKVLATRKLKGASVNRDSFVSIAQQIGLQLSTPIEVQFDTSEYSIESLRDIYGEENVSDEGVVRLRYFGNNAKGTFVNIDGKLITSYVAQTTAHILDSVKVPLPSNVNLLTFNIWRLIPELGGTWNTSTLFISQEAVSDIIAMDNKNKSISGINANKNPIKETKREILKKIYSLMLTNNDARANKIMTDALIAKHGKMSDKDLEARINKQKAYIFKSIKDAKLTNAVINSIEQLLDLPSAISDNDMKEALTNRTNYDSLSIENKIKYLSYQYFIASTYDQYSSISNEIRTFQQNTSFDKSSVGPDFFKINRFTNSVKTILENGTNLLDRNGDDYIRSIYENNSYPTINSYWEHGHEAARNVFASNFITESPAFRHFLSNYNEDIQKTAMYYAIAYNMSTLKFFSDTNKNRLFGLTAQPDLSKIDLTKINKETYEVFKNLSLVNKLLLVKEQYKDYIDSDNVLYYLQPNYKEGQRDNIAFVSDKDDDTFIYSFLKLWYNTNPYLHNLAQDLVKFAYFNNGMEFGRNVSKVIPLDILYNQPEVISEPYGIPIIKGIGYFSHLAKQRHANFNPEYEGIYDVFFRIKFARANYRSNKIVPIVKTEYDMDAQGHMTVRYGTPNWNNNDDFGIIHVSKYEFNTLSPNVKRADVVKRFVNREAKLYAKLEVNDEYYYIPVGKLEKYEFEDNSQITTNNVEHNIDYYIQIINGIDGNNINNETTEEETEIKPTKLRAKMTYAYGNNKRSDVTATTTLEAIKLGQRTATTRYESDKHINFWKNVKVGDIIEFTDNKETVLVEVTRPLNKLVYYTGLEEEWSKKEGWSVDYFRNSVSPRLNEAWQIEYKLVNNNSQPIQGKLFALVANDTDGLSDSLHRFLNKLNFTVEFADDLSSKTEYNAQSLTDLLYKTIIINTNYKDRGLLKESAYVAYSFLGKKNKIRTDLIHSIENIDNYNTIYNDYKKRSPQLTGGKIKELIVIDFIADAIKNNFDNPKDSYQNRKADYWQIKADSKLGRQLKYLLSKIQQFIESLYKDSKLSNVEINNLLDDIAHDVLYGNFSKFGTELSAAQQLTNYNSTISKDNFAKDIIDNFQKQGLLLTGSLSLRRQGTLYREVSEDLHDLDFTLTEDKHGEYFNKLISKLKNDLEGASDIGKGFIQERFKETLNNQYEKHPIINTIKQIYPSFVVTNSFYSNDTITISGDINGYAIDLFFVNKTALDTQVKSFQDWQPIFIAKLKMGRAKDIRDFANYIPFDRKADNKFATIPGFRHFTFNSNEEVIVGEPKKLFALVANDLTNNDFLNYNAARLNYLRSIVNDYNIRKSQFPTDKPIAETVTKLKKIDFGTKELSAQAAAFRIDADYIEKTIELFEKRLYGDTGYTKKEVFDSTIDTNDGRNGFVKFMNYSNTFLKGFERISTLEPIPGDNLSEEEQVINQAIERLLSFTPKISKIRATHTALMNAYFEATITPLSTNPEIKLGIRRLFDAQSDEGKVQLLLDSLGDTHNMFVANFIKRFITQRGIIRNTIRDLQRDYDTKIAEFEAKGFKLEDLLERDSQNRLTNKMIQEFDEAYKEDLENYRHRLIKIEGEFGKYSKEYYEAEREYKKWLLDNLSSEEVEELEKAKFDANDILYSNIEARRLIDRIKDEKNRILANYEGIIDYASISGDDAKRLVELGREEAAIANKYNADGTIKTGNALKISEAVTAYQTAWGEIIKKYYVQDYKAVKFGKLLEKNKNLDTKEAREWIARNTKPRIKDSFWDAFKHYAEVLGKEEKEDNDILKALKPFKDADGRVDGRLVPKELKAKIKEYNENRFKNEEEDKRRKTLKGIIKPKRDEVYNDEYYKEFEDNDRWGKDSRDTDVILIQYKNTIDQILSKYITDEGIVDTSAISYEDIRRINDLNDLIKIRGSVYTVNAARDIFNDWFNKNHETIIDKEAFKKAEAIAKSKGDKYYSQWKKLNTGVNINKTFYKRLDNLRKLYMPTTVTHPERTGTNIDMDAIREQYKVDSFDKLPDNVKATIIKNFQAKGSIYPGNTTTGRSLYTISDYLKKHRHKGKLVVMTDTESAKAYISELYERALTNETYRKNRKWTYRTAVEEQYTSTTTEEYKALLAKHGVDSEWYRNNHIINFRGGIEPVSYWLVRRPADKNMYQENAPSAKLWGYSTVTNKKYVDAVKSTAKKWMNDNTAFVTTEAYQQELINNKANMTEVEFKQWYDENHFYNPYTNTYQPISVWTTMLASKDYVNPTYPNDLFVENNVKEEYQNKEHRSINNEAMPKKTSKYYNKNFDKVKNNPLYQYITGLLNDLTLHYDKDTIAKEGKLPIMYKHTTSNAKEIAQSLIKKAGWYSYPSREIIGENNDSIRMLNMPFMSELMKEKEVPLPNRKEFKDEAEYFERYNAIVEQNKEIRKRNKEYNDAHMNRDFKQVLRMFIDAANSHKFTYEFEHEMRLALEQIRNLDMTKKRTMLEFLRNATKEKLKSSMPSLYEGDPALATKKGINSNLEAHFTAFMDMIFYGEFEEDEGNWTKIARVLQNYTSAKGMWLNTPGAFNNVAYGKTQIALERFSGYFFNNADRIKAEKLYWGASMSMVAELGKEKSNSFVNALIKEFDVVELQDEQAVTDNPDLNKAIIKKLLSANSMYFMHHMGEHYMQNVGLLSMLNSHRLVNGKIMSLTDYTYDARYKAILDSLPVERKGELITFITNNKNKDEYLDGRSDLLRDFVLMGSKELKADYLKHLETIKDQATKEFNGYTRLIDVYELKDGFVKVKEGYTVSDLEYHSFRRRVVSVNQKIHGIYNKLDAGTMQRKAIGRLAIQFKKWMRPGWIKRFGTRTGKSHWNESRGEKDMGMYVNTYKFLTKPIGDNIRRYKELRKSNSEEATVVNAIANIFRDYQNYISNIGVYWHTLTDSDKADIRRTMVESLYFIAVATAMWMLQGLADGDDDDKKWAYALYATDRLKTEILAYQPLYGFSNETRKLMRDPFAAMAAMDDLVKLLYTVMFESDDIYKGGIYHGETKASVTFYKTIPLLNRYLRYSNIESYAGYYKLY